MLETEVELPTGIIAKVREMTGEEEDLFLDKKKLTDGRAVNHLLHNCTLTMQEVVDGERTEPAKPDYNKIALTLLSADRIALMLAIRRLTYGPDIKGVTKCEQPECRESIDLELSLDRIDKYETTIQDVPDGKYQTKLEDGTVCQMQLMNGQGEQNVNKAPREDLLTMAIMVCIESAVLPGNKPLMANDKRKWLKKMPARMRHQLRDEIEAHHIGHDTRFDAVCPECGFENAGTLEQLPNFFFPSRISMKTV